LGMVEDKYGCHSESISCGKVDMQVTLMDWGHPFAS
jgi:hypothetical protein